MRHPLVQILFYVILFAPACTQPKEQVAPKETVTVNENCPSTPVDTILLEEIGRKLFFPGNTQHLSGWEKKGYVIRATWSYQDIHYKLFWFKAGPDYPPREIKIAEGKEAFSVRSLSEIGSTTYTDVDGTGCVNRGKYAEEGTMQWGQEHRYTEDFQVHLHGSYSDRYQRAINGLAFLLGIE